MPALIIALVLLVALGLGGNSEEARVKQSVNFKVEVDSKGNSSTSIGFGAEIQDPDTRSKSSLEQMIMHWLGQSAKTLFGR